MDHCLGHARPNPHLCRRRVRPGRFCEGRDRPRPTDDLDGPIGRGDAARARGGHPDLAFLVTNVWQMLAGPALTVVVHRLWPMLLTVCLGTWAGLGLMTGATARFGSGLIGVALVLYTMTGLIAFRPSAPKLWEPILSPVVGAITGLTTAATGVFVIPAVPYLQAIGFEKEELVQALGLSFTVSTMA